ncbi:MAG TPA: hypothetical protein VEQ59_22995 [Polyangiaceae bacterium]|nr:hypothetical protein [Polyangiaceae bacterium]
MTLYYRVARSEALTRVVHAGSHDDMHHEFTYVGSNAVLSSHVCNVCGLVVAIASSEPASTLPTDGCCIRSEAPAARASARPPASKPPASRSPSAQLRAVSAAT